MGLEDKLPLRSVEPGTTLPGRNAVEARLIAEACAMSLREHRPLRLDEVRE